MTKIALVTGANGQLGQEFVGHLLSKNYFVYSIDIVSSTLFNTRNVQMVNLDITNSEAVGQFFSSISKLDLFLALKKLLAANIEK